jgi:hypothetical protein
MKRGVTEELKVGLCVLINERQILTNFITEEQKNTS